MFFKIKIDKKSFLLQKCIGNDFYNENALEMIFTKKKMQ